MQRREEILAELEAILSGEVRPRRHHGDRHRGDGRRRVRLRPRSLPLRRLPPLRLRLRPREQPVARPADPLDPGARDGQGQRHRLRRVRHLLRSRRSSRAREVLSPGGVPAVPQPRLRQGLSGQGHLAGTRRHRGHRLRLVSRLPLLHVGLPLRRPPLQLDRTDHRGGGDQPRHPRLRQSAAAQGRGGEMHLLHPENPKGTLSRLCGDLPGRGAQVRQSPRRGRGRCATSCARNGSSSSKRSSTPNPASTTSLRPEGGEQP